MSFYRYSYTQYHPTELFRMPSLLRLIQLPVPIDPILRHPSESMPPRSSHAATSCKHTGPTRIYRLHLRLRPAHPPEPRRQLFPIPHLALARLHTPQLMSGLAANASIRLLCRRRCLRLRGSTLRGLLLLATQGPVLDDAVAVLCERLRKRLRGRLGMGVGCVVDV